MLLILKIVDIEIGAPDWDNAGTGLNNGDTMPADGWVAVTFYAAASGNGTCSVYINGKSAASCDRTSSSLDIQPAIIPVSKGDKITWTAYYADVASATFYPCK